MKTISQAAAILAGHQQIASAVGMSAHHVRMAAGRKGVDQARAVGEVGSWSCAHQETSRQLRQAQAEFASVAAASQAANEADFFCPAR